MVVSIQFSTVKKGQHGCHMCSVASFSRPTRRSRYASSVQLDAMASLLHEHHVRHNHLCPSSNYKCHCTSSLFTSTLCTGIKKNSNKEMKSTNETSNIAINMCLCPPRPNISERSGARHRELLDRQQIGCLLIPAQETQCQTLIFAPSHLLLQWPRDNIRESWHS